ncbi:MAG: alpha/beta hydrolase, partial [Acidimicrobiales bacterium]|nr:alpha/beta hydrolase [Acidimicrobiales bacterium]
MTEFVKVSEDQIAVKTLGVLDGRPTIVMLHEGLGSITQWRDLPDSIHTATGLPVLLYDRSGYGRSSASSSHYNPDFMHLEARETLPTLLRQLNISKPILFGHSDGG